MKMLFQFILMSGVMIMTLNAHADEKKSTNANPVVIMTTSKGIIEIELFSDRAPDTVSNFLSYVLQSYYDGTIFHRVIDGFMIQGGGFTPDMVKKPTMDPIKNEASNKISNKRGTISMARMPSPHSATSQFFINHRDNSALDFKNNSERGFGYCVFGRVINGMDIVDKIAQVNTRTYNDSSGKMGDVPSKTVLIESVSIKK